MICSITGGEALVTMVMRLTALSAVISDTVRLALVKVAGTGDRRIEALRLAEVYRARVVDATISSPAGRAGR
jgi:acetolactate synthase-1/3 small subunit